MDDVMFAHDDQTWATVIGRMLKMFGRRGSTGQELKKSAVYDCEVWKIGPPEVS